MSDDELEDVLRLELLRADHRYLTKHLADLDRQMKFLADLKHEVERQLAENEKQWK